MLRYGLLYRAAGYGLDHDTVNPLKEVRGGTIETADKLLDLLHRLTPVLYGAGKEPGSLPTSRLAVSIRFF